jgi:alanyl-tRNA synthetase
MDYKSAKEIRQTFLDFFKNKDHIIVPSAPVVIKDDPTLLFTNAGMNQFKDYFLGNKPAPSSRIADTQKCLRVSGKHNDLEEVGVDTYHHTLFEMLGNWSFGDPKNPNVGYFKEEAIAWSWELLAEVFQIPKDRLYVTVFEGDAKENLPPDTEALNFWKQWIAEDRILFGNKKDNFWEMGDTGPCGPCTEIHVDCRPDNERAEVDGKTLVNNDHPQVIEIWNNVFIQFNRLKDGSLELLPARHVDTGMGFERLVRVLQGKSSNYDTDVFSGTIQSTELLSGKKYDGSDSKEAIAFRVIADHIRAVSFTIADGQLPSNTGAGYVIRRILRRAVRYYFSYLDTKTPLLHKLVPVLATQFEAVFPELKQQQEFVARVILEEENNFLKTLDAGLKKMAAITAEGNEKSIDGKTAFELFDTFGFPLDLTRLVAQESGFSVDEKGFEEQMKLQKERSRAATELDMSDWVVLKDGSVKFVGYDQLTSETQILRYRSVKSKGKEQYQLVLETTPFYAESGGQVGDKGTLTINGQTIQVTDTRKELDLIVHFTDTLPTNPEAKVVAQVNNSLRESSAIHHSATHLLHAALRTVLGTHVAQKGSLVNADYLRFDFSHFAKMSDEEISQVENIVNEKIRENVPVIIKELPKEEALKLGAMALFGEKYGDVVRVVIMDAAYSVELCGGTHVGYTGQIGYFKLMSEAAVAAGVRRVEALAGAKAISYLEKQASQLEEVKELLRQPKDIAKTIKSLQDENTLLKKEVEQYQLEKADQLKQYVKSKIVQSNGFSFAIQSLQGITADGLKKIAFELRQECNDLILVLTANIHDKPFIAVAIADSLVASKNLNAGKVVKTLAAHINGGGGGQPFYATAGGTDLAGINAAISEANSWINTI